MIFKNERQLQQKIAEFSFGFFSEYPVTYIRREVRVGGCIPDLVSIHFEQDPNSFSWPSRWSTRHSYTLWLLRDRTLTVEEISEAFYEPIDKVKPVINFVISAGLAFINKRGKVSLSTQANNITQANVVAVEAKLRDWRQALNQAIRYKDFADIVFVAMDASNIPTSKDYLNIFKEQKIGLCAVTDSSYDWIFEPVNRREPIGHEKEYLLMSATIPSTQRLWSRRNNFIASNQV